MLVVWEMPLQKSNHGPLSADVVTIVPPMQIDSARNPYLMIA